MTEQTRQVEATLTLSQLRELRAGAETRLYADGISDLDTQIWIAVIAVVERLIGREEGGSR